MELLLQLPWRSPLQLPPLLVLKPLRLSIRTAAVSAVLEHSSSSSGDNLSARERRQLRNSRRESRSSNWREEVEERLIRKPKKEKVSWTEKLNLDNLAKLGPQWWVVRVSRITGHESAERVARSLARRFPDLEFKVYHPAVKVKRKLKSGSYTIKHKPLFPGCVFLYCVLNKEIHDFIRECDGVGGFLGSKVGSTKRQINRPKPVAADEMDAIFRQAREEQEKADRLSPENQEEETSDQVNNFADRTKAMATKHGRRGKKGSQSSTDNIFSERSSDALSPGATVRVLSGPFTELTGRLKELNQETGKAKVEFILFGKESDVDLEADQIVVDVA